jgi:2-phospho-L-lactate guanylyltransferase
MPGHRTPLTGVPIKPFGVAKQRLHPRLSREKRSRLGRDIAAHTLRTIATVGGDVVVVSSDLKVQSWAAGIGFASSPEGPAGSGLNGAVLALQQRALREGRPWLAVHADLPLLSPTDVAPLLERLESGSAVIAPSHDGGTSALGAQALLEPRYGIGSYQRHLSALSRFPAVATLCRPGLAFDLDTVADLDMLIAAEPAGWIKAQLEAIDSLP